MSPSSSLAKAEATQHSFETIVKYCEEAWLVRLVL